MAIDGNYILDQYGRPTNGQARGPGYYDPSVAVPHIITFSAIISSAQKAYYHDRFDEALKHAREDALVMRRDCFLMGLLKERKLATASKNWYIRVDDESSNEQKAFKNHMTLAVRQTPFWQKMMMSLLEWIWYGKYAVQVAWQWKMIDGKRTLTCKKWIPLNGDKIGHLFDGTPYISIHPAEAESLPNAEIVITTVGAKGLVLRGSWRERFVIGSHEIDDADYFDAEMAEGIHGIGVRSRLFWLDWLKREYLSWLVDFLERVGLGVTIYYFDASNPASEAKARTAAVEQNRRSIILWPKIPGDRSSGIERVETPTAGADVLLRMQQHIEEIEERYVIGQTMSSGRDNSSGLGGTGRAQFAENTKFDNTKYDCQNLGEVLTKEFLATMVRWTYPEIDFGYSLEFAIDDPRLAMKLDAVTKAYSIGVDFIKDEVRNLTGMSAPEPGDTVIESPNVGFGLTGGGAPGNEGKGAAGRQGIPKKGAGASGARMPFFGPRGGTYEITSSGKKRHVSRFQKKLAGQIKAIRQMVEDLPRPPESTAQNARLTEKPEKPREQSVNLIIQTGPQAPRPVPVRYERDPETMVIVRSVPEIPQEDKKEKVIQLEDVANADQPGSQVDAGNAS